jgi:signal transduction histidine kinase
MARETSPASGFTIRRRLIRANVVVTLTALVLATSAFVPFYVLAGRRSITRDLTVQTATIAFTTSSALVFNDSQAATDALRALSADSDVVVAGIYGADGRLFASYDAHVPNAPALPASIPATPTKGVQFTGTTAYADHAVESNGRRIGTVRIVYTLSELLADFWRFLLLTGVALVISVGGALVAAVRVQRDLTAPIADLADAARRVSQNNDYSVRVADNHAVGELGTLIDTFNRMLGQIQTRDDELDAARQRYQALNEQLEQRVAERTAELQAINKELETFTYSVSHDLRAPLRRIDGFSGMLSTKFGSELGADGTHLLSRVRESTQHMGHLIDDLLNLARLGRKDVVLRPTDLSEIVQHVIAELAPDCEGRMIAWQVDPLPTVDADPALMDVVLTNLISNAVKYSRPRAEAIVHIGTRHTAEGTPIIFVRDNGVGFNMKYADKLFGAFQRLHRADEFEGTGIGLATVQRIIHKHKGSIWVEAELDKGATFYFSIGAPVTIPPATEGAVRT